MTLLLLLQSPRAFWCPDYILINYKDKICISIIIFIISLKIAGLHSKLSTTHFLHAHNCGLSCLQDKGSLLMSRCFHWTCALYDILSYKSNTEKLTPYLKACNPAKMGLATATHFHVKPLVASERPNHIFFFCTISTLSDKKIQIRPKNTYVECY